MAPMAMDPMPAPAARSREAWPRYLLWIRAAATAPDVVDRANGERRRTLERALAGVISRRLGTDAGLDVRPQATAAPLVAANEAVVDFWVRRGGVDDLDALFDRAGRQLADLGLGVPGNGGRIGQADPEPASRPA